MNNQAKAKKRRKFIMPSAFAMLFGIILVLIILTWIPAISDRPAGILDLFFVAVKGLQEKIEIIVFILVLGGFLNVVMQSQALEAAIAGLLRKLKGKEIWIIPIVMTLTSIGGTTFGMVEETLAFYPIIIPVMVAAGFDVMTGILTVLLGAGVGCLGSTLNPFAIGIAVDETKKAGVDIGTTAGITWRTISWILITAAAIGYVIWYAKRVKKDPTKSKVYELYDEHRQIFVKEGETPEFTKKRKAILWIFGFTFLFMIVAVISWSSFGITIFDAFGKKVNGIWYDKDPDCKPLTNVDRTHQNAGYITGMLPAIGRWYMIELATLFFISTLIIAALNWKGEKHFINTFVTGSAGMLEVCFIIAVASGVGIVLEHSGMGDKLVKAISNGLKGMNSISFVTVAFIIFLPLSFLIPSSSGFATVVFKIMGPVSAILNVASGTITAFSFASGVLNLFTPTSGVVMASLALGKVPYDKYIKASWPFILISVLLSIILLISGAAIQNGIGTAGFQLF